MALTDPNEARLLVKKALAQPAKILFGAERAIFRTYLALFTPLLRDSKKRKGWSCAHTIVKDLPGTGKTALFNYVSDSLSAKLGRVDGRPDLLPIDFTGKEDRDKFTGIRTMLFGPLFSHILFADEINRTPPKSQAPFLGAMEGGHVILNKTDEKRGVIEPVAFPLYPVPNDTQGRNFFIVFATMNPIEFEGTYPLSEAQMERFTYDFGMGAPTREQEMMIRFENVMHQEIEIVMDLGQVLDIQDMVKKIRLSPQADELIMRHIENSWPPSKDKYRFGESRKRHTTTDLVKFTEEYVISGLSRRRNYHMQMAALTHRLMRLFLDEDKEIISLDNIVAEVDDVKAIAPLTMEHVILLHPKAANEYITTEDVVQRIVSETALP
ncbi:MAG: AAA family ATPase [Patescibacteria group bacterium]